jgi:hypothetical protein
MNKKYNLCRLERKTEDGVEVAIGWIDNTVAVTTNRVELKGQDGLWDISTVDPGPITKDQLDRLQISAHKGFASIKET